MYCPNKLPICYNVIMLFTYVILQILSSCAIAIMLQRQGLKLHNFLLHEVNSSIVKANRPKNGYENYCFNSLKKYLWIFNYKPA